MICCADMIAICLILLQKKPASSQRRGCPFFIFSFTGFAHGDFSLMTKKFKNILQTVPVASMLKLCTISIGHLIKKLKKER
ncbi:hypothetical protein ATZ36_15135 [Candidatus Endomicrobiellum trichonymphae]|uniref:Uncharacterized protein n=1 Tax=Endomicrobium trichonymphae TaxID=1408204 RepID=A0A1E5IN17_ENDTX|nr:hypothetical protein ATZ36_15135 [Candidatus Endomicrobium trichonymphae]